MTSEYLTFAGLITALQTIEHLTCVELMMDFLQTIDYLTNVELMIDLLQTIEFLTSVELMIDSLQTSPLSIVYGIRPTEHIY